MKNKKNPLTKKIKLAMLESGLNQSELAKIIGITRQSLSGWLASCENPKLENIKKIAKATNKPVNYFFENSGNIADNNSTISVAERSSNYEIAMLQKDMEIVKKEIEILKMKMENKK